MNPEGVARFEFGQYKAWQVGIHGTADRHEALIQTGAPVTVYRDLNKDFKRDEDKTDTGFFALNHHWGYDKPTNDIDYASAGSLVGRTRQGHREFLNLIKQDERYVEDPRHVFSSTIISGSDLANRFSQ